MAEEPTNIAFATIKKLRSDDGFWQLPPTVKIGQQLMVDFDSRKTGTWNNVSSGRQFSAETIQVMWTDEKWIAFPTELLQF